MLFLRAPPLQASLPSAVELALSQAFDSMSVMELALLQAFPININLLCRYYFEQSKRLRTGESQYYTFPLSCSLPRSRARLECRMWARSRARLFICYCKSVLLQSISMTQFHDFQYSDCPLPMFANIELHLCFALIRSEPVFLKLPQLFKSIAATVSKSYLNFSSRLQPVFLKLPQLISLFLH